MEHKILICEDNLFQAQKLEAMVNNGIIMVNDLGESFLVEDAVSSYSQAIELVRKKKIQAGIYFLDVQLSSRIDQTGLDLAEQIKKYDSRAIFVFVTSHEEMALETYVRRIEPVDYIIKCADSVYMQRRITETLELASRRFKVQKHLESETFSCTSGRRQITINIDDVLCIVTTTHAHKLKLISKNGMATFTGSIRQVAEDYKFLTKISQSCLVNFANVSEVDYRNMVVLFSTGRQEFFSRRFVKNIKSKFRN